MDDCISRQAVLDVTWEEPSYTDALNVLTEIRDKIKALPNVTPTERSGHWILLDGQSIYFDLYSCSECDVLCGTPTYNYCPNCGARMEDKG